MTWILKGAEPNKCETVIYAVVYGMGDDKGPSQFFPELRRMFLNLEDAQAYVTDRVVVDNWDELSS
jgi:arginine/ornithine N-succinyltransferase beta subunit